MVIEVIKFFNYLNLLPTYFSSNFMFNLFNIIREDPLKIVESSFKNSCNILLKPLNFYTRQLINPLMIYSE